MTNDPIGGVVVTPLWAATTAAGAGGANRQEWVMLQNKQRCRPRNGPRSAPEAAGRARTRFGTLVYELPAERLTEAYRAIPEAIQLALMRTGSGLSHFIAESCSKQIQ